MIALCLPNTGANLASLERPQGKTRLDLVQRSKSEGDRAVFEGRKAALRIPAPSDSKDPAEIARQEKLKAALQTVSDDDLFRYSVGEIRNFEAYLGVDYTPRLARTEDAGVHHSRHRRSRRAVRLGRSAAQGDPAVGDASDPRRRPRHPELRRRAVALRDWVARVLLKAAA